MLDWLASRFKHIHWARGNHETRAERVLGVALDDEMVVARLIDKTGLKPGQLTFSAHEHTRVETPCGVYRISHPQNYSRNPPAVEKRLAEKYHCHVIGTHGHMVASAFDISGDFLCYQVGGMFDARKIDYKVMRETTHPEWTNGFGILADGLFYHYVKHPTNPLWSEGVA